MAIRKYGWNNIAWDIIDNAETIEELNEKEVYWIKYYNTYIGLKNANGYNMTEGGGGTLGYHHSEESKKLMSENRKGTTTSAELKLKMSKDRTGDGNANAKITEDIAREIKIRLASGERNIDVRKEFGVTQKIVEHIKGLTSWKHLLPVLNDLLIESKRHSYMSKDNAIEINKKLALGESLSKLSIEYNVSTNCIRMMRNLTSWKELLPELNSEIVKYIDKSRVNKRFRKDNNT